MKIRLLVDLPIAPAEGAVEGRVFEVTSAKKRGRDRLYMFNGDTGSECGAWEWECEEVKGD